MVRETAFRVYVSDSLYYSAREQMLTNRYSDMIGKKQAKEDNRSGEEIAADVIKRAGLVVI